MSTCFICTQPSSVEEPLLRLQCGKHKVCKPCLRVWINQVKASQANYPPRCCMPLDLQALAIHLGQTEFIQYRSRVLEYATPPDKRVYCNLCERFAPSSPDSLETRCEHCKIVICTKCGGKEHAKQYVCHPAKLDTELESLMKKEGWKSCPNCTAVIELREACNHVTCGYCGHAICYSCGLKWPCPAGCPPYGKAVQTDSANPPAKPVASPIPSTKVKQVPARYLNAQNQPAPLNQAIAAGAPQQPLRPMTRRDVVRHEENLLTQVALHASLGLPIPLQLQHFLDTLQHTQDPASMHEGEFPDEEEEDDDEAEASDDEIRDSDEDDSDGAEVSTEVGDEGEDGDQDHMGQGGEGAGPHHGQGQEEAEAHEGQIDDPESDSDDIF